MSGSTSWSVSMKFIADWTVISSPSSALFWARLFRPTRLIDTTAARMPRIEMTTSISMSVNPPWERRLRACHGSPAGIAVRLTVDIQTRGWARALDQHGARALPPGSPSLRRAVARLVDGAIRIAVVLAVGLLLPQVPGVEGDRLAGRRVGVGEAPARRARRERRHVLGGRWGRAGADLAHRHLLLVGHGVHGELDGLLLGVGCSMLGQLGDAHHAHRDHRGEDAEDGDDHQQLDQREAPLVVLPQLPQKLAISLVHSPFLPPGSEFSTVRADGGSPLRYRAPAGGASPAGAPRRPRPRPRPRPRRRPGPSPGRPATGAGCAGGGAARTG